MPDMVNHPPHYTSHPSGIECIDVTREMTFDSGNAFKYVYRADEKNGQQDIEKARWYLRDALEHNDVVILARKIQNWRQLVETVIDFEPDKVRQIFYRAIQLRQLGVALEAVNTMLKDYEPLPYSPADYSADLYYGIEG